MKRKSYCHTRAAVGISSCQTSTPAVWHKQLSHGHTCLLHQCRQQDYELRRPRTIARVIYCLVLRKPRTSARGIYCLVLRRPRTVPSEYAALSSGGQGRVPAEYAALSSGDQGQCPRNMLPCAQETKDTARGICCLEPRRPIKESASEICCLEFLLCQRARPWCIFQGQGLFSGYIEGEGSGNSLI